jgi:GNAT superfamily N-acetyltransferase
VSLIDGYHHVPEGKIATVITYLEMRAPQPLRPAPEPDGWTLRQVKAPSLDWYRQMFRAVGAEWLWFSRLELSDEGLSAVLEDPNVKFWTLSKGKTDGALLELRFSDDEHACEIAFFGLVPELVGQGAGRFLMNAALTQAWAPPVKRVHLQTCTLDSAQALPFYLRTGFTPTRQEIQIADDPRLKGLLPRRNGVRVPMS